ncbi:Ref family recombination enhancement nuclease [Citrobacter cronae]|uniref:Ref family recombination enhancement nuclease n=1 Tax=Citrobacter cronae TaxID=1748967 RepID=UPI0030EE923B
MKKRASKSDKQHFQNLVDIGCIVCKVHLGVYSVPEIHHIRTGQGIAQRADHKKTLPLCPPHHRTGGYGVAIHAGQKTWEENYGSETELLEQVTIEVKELRLCRI